MHNPIPPKLSYGLVETIAMKFTRPLPATTPKELTYADGNFAIDSARGSPARIQTLLVDAQWIVLALGLVLFVRAGPRPRILSVIGGVLGAHGRRHTHLRIVAVAKHPQHAARPPREGGEPRRCQAGYSQYARRAARA